MYRFRTTDNLLGKYKELENQEIYFASPEELNDPMEGFKNVYWRRDSIVWENFLINYIKSLERIFSLTILLNDKIEISESDILVSRELLKYNSPSHKILVEKIIENTFSINLIRKLPNIFSLRKEPIRRFQLLSYLTTLHQFVINSISKVYFDNKLTNKFLFYQNISELEKILEANVDFFKVEDKKTLNNDEGFFEMISLYTQSSSLISKYKSTNVKSNGFILLSEFPYKFVSKLESEIYPPWYSASFLIDNSNPAIWGHYGDSHKGVCLKFKTINDDNSSALKLKTECGFDNIGPIFDMKPHKFQAINYTYKHIEIDFFNSFGRLTIGESNKLWYSDTKGNLSKCGKHLKNKQNEWQRIYWSNFNKSIRIKLKEWEYEKEYRLVVDGFFKDYSSKKSRKLKYNFKDLESITFGIKTKNSEKFQIIKIVEEKCKNQGIEKFDFFQAYYSKVEGKINSFKLQI